MVPRSARPGGTRPADAMDATYSYSSRPAADRGRRPGISGAPPQGEAEPDAGAAPGAEDLQGVVALVTGASGGIGGAIALGLAERGAALWLVGRRANALDEVARRADGAAAVTTCPADLTDGGEIQRLAERVEREARQLNLLVLCSGTIAFGPVADAPVEELDDQYAANLRAPYMITQALLPLLRESQGQVVFINSTAGLGPRPGAAQFAATQAAFKAVADTLRQEVNEEGVRVLSVYPGRTATSRQRHMHELEGKDYRPELLMQPDDVTQMVVSAVKLPRTAEVTDIVMRPLARPPQSALPDPTPAAHKRGLRRVAAWFRGASPDLCVYLLAVPEFGV